MHRYQSLQGRAYLQRLPLLVYLCSLARLHSDEWSFNWLDFDPKSSCLLFVKAYRSFTRPNSASIGCASIGFACIGFDEVKRRTTDIGPRSRFISRRITAVMVRFQKEKNKGHEYKAVDDGLWRHFSRCILHPGSPPSTFPS